VSAALWTPSPERRAAATVARFAAAAGRPGVGYEELRRWSLDDLEGFWEAVASFYGIDVPAGTEVLHARRMPGARWFEGVALNYAEEVLRRAPAGRPAIVSLGEDGEQSELSAQELRGRVGALAARLRELGLGSGDRVAAYLPNIPEAVVGLLATARIGAVWTACAPDFGAQSVIDRFGQVEPKVLLAVDGYTYNGRVHDRRDALAELQAALPSLRATLLVRSAFGEDETFAAACAPAREPEFARVPFAHPLWILFSSGTTGLPKGLVHSHGGIVLEHLKALGLCLDLKPDDRYLFHSSTSWMAWNYLVGGLLHGATIVLYDGSPGAGAVDALFGVAERTGATVLGMGSAYVSACEKAGAEPGRRRSLGALRTVIPTGSPLPASGWEWLHRQLGPDVRIDSICGGTDVCTAFFGGSELLPVHAGEISCRWLGVDARARGTDGRDLVGEVGEFVVAAPMPSMPVALWDDDEGERLQAAYFEAFPGVWRQGDWITISEGGSVTVSGRSDATLNRGGVRIGSAEIYGVVEALPQVADALVVGLEQSDGGYWLPLFVVPSDGVAVDDALRAEIARAIGERLSPRHAPDEIVAAPAIPRTLTGKKLEVPVKRILQGAAPDAAAARGSIDRPDALDWFAAFAAGRAPAPA
jgi:acetoacetyl-CoA synthetase